MTKMSVEAPVIAIPGMNCSPALWSTCNFPENTVHFVPAQPSMNKLVKELDKEIQSPTILVGLSLGGIIAMRFARRFPEKVRGILLMATNSLAPTPQQLDGWKISVQEVEDGLTPTKYQESISEKLVASDINDQEKFQRLAVEIAEPISAEVLKNQLLAQITRTDELGYLPKLRVPVEVLCGSNDAICPVRRHEEIHEAVPDSNLEIIPGAGHLLSLTHPKHVDEAYQRLRVRTQS